MILNIAKLSVSAIFATILTLAITVLVYSLDSFEIWGMPDYAPVKMIQYLNWGLAGLFVIIAMVTTPVSDYLVGVFLSIRKPSLREEAVTKQAVSKVEEHYYLVFGKRLKIRLRVMDAPYAGAMSFGRRTIVVTNGLLKNFNEDEIIAVIAHETGHVHYKDSAANLLSNLCIKFTAFIPFVFLFPFFGNRNDKDNATGTWVDGVSVVIFFWIVFNVP